MRKPNRHIESSLDDFLKEEGVLEETWAIVIKETVAFQIQQAMEVEKISKVESGAVWLLDQIRRVGPQATAWAQAMLAARGIEGVRVLQGLLHLAERHPWPALDEACAVALAHISYRLRTIRELLKRHTPRQEVLPFLNEHPLIRTMAEYAQFVQQALQQEATP